MKTYNFNIPQHLILIIILSTAASVFVFAWYHDWIIFSFPYGSKPAAYTSNSTCTKKTVTIFIPPKKHFSETCEKEIKEILWSDNPENNILTLARAWAALVDEETIIQKKITLQAASFTHKDHLIISCDRAPFNKYDAVSKKYATIQSLIKTLHKEFPTLQTIRFFVHHVPIRDEDLDFTQPWPVQSEHEKTSHEPILQDLSFLQKPTLSIVIDPAGDAQRTGRIIDDVFERSITLRCAQELKKQLESLYPHVKVYLTRFSGDTIEPLQSAVFANRLNADLFISLHCYQESSNTPCISCITFSYDAHDYRAHKTPHALSFSPLHKAYQNTMQKNLALAHALHTYLTTRQKHMYRLEPCAEFPYKPLLGITTPAVGIEFGLTKKDDWLLVLNELSRALQKMLAHYHL